MNYSLENVGITVKQTDQFFFFFISEYWMTNLDFCQLIFDSVWVGRNWLSIFHHLMSRGKGIQNVLQLISELKKKIIQNMLKTAYRRICIEQQEGYNS